MNDECSVRKASYYFVFGGDENFPRSALRERVWSLKLNTSRSVSLSWDGCLVLVLVLALESSHQRGLWHFLRTPERCSKVRLLYYLTVLGKPL